MEQGFATQPPAAPVYQLSGWWRRAGAFWIDCVVLFGVTLPLIVAIALIGGVDFDDYFMGSTFTWFDAATIPLQFAIPALYYAWIMPKTGGQTLGKKATGIRVVRETGQPVDVGFSLFRQILVINFLFWGLAVFLLFIPTLLNYLWPLWDDKNQALHDKIVKSRVVLAEELPVTVEPAPVYQAPTGFENPVPEER